MSRGKRIKSLLPRDRGTQYNRDCKKKKTKKTRKKNLSHGSAYPPRSRCSCYHFFFFFLPGYPLSRSVSNARYVTSRVPAYKEVKDVWKCSCRSNIYIYIRVFSSLGILCDFISLVAQLSLSSSIVSVLFFFFLCQGGASSQRRELSFDILYSSVIFLFAERSVIILIYEKLDRSVKSSDLFHVRNIYPELDISKDRRFEETFIGYSPSSISTLTVIRSRVSVVSKVKLPADVYRCKDSIWLVSECCVL